MPEEKICAFCQKSFKKPLKMGRSQWEARQFCSQRCAVDAREGREQGIWSDGRIAILRQSWLDGLSASQIANKLGGVTRSAVLGKVNRLGLPGRAPRPTTGETAPRKPARSSILRPTPVRPKLAKRDTAPKVTPDLKQMATLMKMAEEEKPAAPISFDELENHSCRYVVNDGIPVWLFCGAQKAPGSSYCSRHHAACHVPGTAYRSSHPPKVPEYTEELNNEAA